MTRQGQGALSPHLFAYYTPDGRKCGPRSEPAAVRPLLEMARGLGVRVCGLSFHVGSLVSDSSKFVEALTQTELQFPDEMSPDELTHYRAHIQEFRTRLAV